jgi:hypothetical protein
MPMTDNRDTPVLFLIFNRPDTTARVFDAIVKAKPRFLFIAADGARPEKPGESEKCRATREIIKQINWECEVQVLFHDHNLGCKASVSSAISWFFEHVEEGIILEDDCLPSESFFSFCTELLVKYSDDKRIMMISGNNFQNGIQRGDAGYYFSSIPWIWGWATWKRAWKLYDLSMRTFPAFVREHRMYNVSQNLDIQNYRWKCFIPAYEDKIDTWDYQWIYAILINNGLSICPQTNLVSNIGFTSEATHTRDGNSKFANIPLGEISDLNHPWAIQPDVLADNYFYKHYLNVDYSHIKNPLKRWKKNLEKRHHSKKFVERFASSLEEKRTGT